MTIKIEVGGFDVEFQTTSDCIAVLDELTKPSTLNRRDEILRTMLNTPPQPHSVLRGQTNE